MEHSYFSLIESGDIFLKDSQLQEALACYSKALTFSPQGDSLLRLYSNLAVTYKRLGRLQEAEAVIQKGILINPNYTSFYSNLSSIYKLQNRFAEAVASLQKAITLGSGLNDYLNIIELYKHQKAFKDAFNVAAAAIKKFPNEYEAHLALGNLFASVKAFDKSISPYLKAIELAPSKAPAYNNIGVAYKELGDNQKSLTAYQKALQINPNNAAAHNNIGNLLRNIGDTDAAIRHLDYSIKLNPMYANAYSNLGAVYKELKDYDAAIVYYKKALELNPEHTDANFDMALIELSHGNYRSGWEKYEHRLKMPELLSKTYKYKTPMWKGENLRGKTIILQNEQGFGDNIMFIRYVPNFLALGAEVIIRTRPELVKLFETIDGVAKVCSEDENTMPEHDFYIPLLSCPYRFDTQLDSIPAKFPYLHPNKEHINIGFDDSKTNIGIVWSSSRTNKDFKNKYIGIQNYVELLNIEQTKWFSLQAGEDASQIQKEGFEGRVVDLSSELIDFSATAAIIDTLDVIITTDTSVAHLCGAMNKETYVLVPKPADWRWMQDGDSTPWYPSLKIFRQTQKGSWKEPISAIAKLLRQRIKEEKRAL
ncbi:MAG: tetratricopeptide repeat protein [Campylobacteraceae bacterium]|nr:tetratricopeptide repeat protein [Campylobacteraceae bacterium]